MKMFFVETWRYHAPRSMEVGEDPTFESWTGRERGLVSLKNDTLILVTDGQGEEIRIPGFTRDGNYFFSLSEEQVAFAQACLLAGKARGRADGLARARELAHSSIATEWGKKGLDEMRFLFEALDRFEKEDAIDPVAYLTRK